MKWAKALFEPRGVAVVGSASQGKIGYELIQQLTEGGFDRVVAVNPKGVGAFDVPGVTSLSEIPEDMTVDLAVIAAPAATVAGVLEDCGRAGVGAAVLITAGFSESGNHAEEEKVLRVAHTYGIRIIGPNCAGIVNTRHRLFPTLETRPPAGDVAFISQSGALGGAVLSWAEEQGMGFSKFVSYGNAADLSEIDLLDYLRNDEETKAVALYIESVSDGRRFMETARRLSAVKPLIVIKSGRSESGGRATLSHTGSMAGADAVYDAALTQCGAIRVAGVEEMFDLCRGFVSLPPVKGKRIAIVTNSGGPGVLATDAAESVGLEIISPSDALRTRLKETLHPYCSLGNPIDLTVQGTEDDYRNALVEILDEADAALAINVNTPYLDASPLARGVVAAAQATGKPVVANFMAGRTVETALPVLQNGDVPNFATGERAVRALGEMASWAAGCGVAEAGPRIADETRELPWEGQATEIDAMRWLQSNGVPVIAHRLCRTVEEAVEAQTTFDRPVAMKVVSPEILHKTDVGGVMLGLATGEEIGAAFDRMREIGGATFEGVLVTPMADHPVEVLVGLTRDPQFGPVIAVGMGGVLTEVLHDVCLRVAPVDEAEARRMLASLRGQPLLEGHRGRPACDISALAGLISRVSDLPFVYPEIGELDLNPVFCSETGCEAADARVVRET